MTGKAQRKSRRRKTLITVDFPSGKMQVRRGWSATRKRQKGKNHQPGILHPAQSSPEREVEMLFQTKLRKAVVAYRLALKDTLKDVQREERGSRSERLYEKRRNKGR